MKLSIQDPKWRDSVYLLESILQLSEGALSGAGVYAFASPAGVKLLLQDATFQRFLARAPFDLIVGVDAVTNGTALDMLGQAEARYPNLSVRVFFDEASQNLFHPKICWFNKGRQSYCLVGSGNLTAGGLRGNCEVFGSTRLEGLNKRTFEATWSSWMNFNRPRFFPPDNPQVRARALRNTGIETPGGRRGRRNANSIREDAEGNIVVGPGREESDAVLIAEIPRSADRWNQANFDLYNFQHFFGATPGQTQRIILTHVETNGRLSPPEVRPSVSSRSQNYRFELNAAAGLPYPNARRPIAVFLRTATRSFRYHLFMPGSREYNSISSYLRQHSQIAGNRVFRLPTTVRELMRNNFSQRTLDLLRTE